MCVIDCTYNSNGFYVHVFNNIVGVLQLFNFCLPSYSMERSLSQHMQIFILESRLDGFSLH